MGLTSAQILSFLGIAIGAFVSVSLTYLKSAGENAFGRKVLQALMVPVSIVLIVLFCFFAFFLMKGDWQPPKEDEEIARNLIFGLEESFSAWTIEIEGLLDGHSVWTVDSDRKIDQKRADVISSVKDFDAQISSRIETLLMVTREIQKVYTSKAPITTETLYPEFFSELDGLRKFSLNRLKGVKSGDNLDQLKLTLKSEIQKKREAVKAIRK